jgi:hypothetical protein
MLSATQPLQPCTRRQCPRGHSNHAAAQPRLFLSSSRNRAGYMAGKAIWVCSFRFDARVGSGKTADVSFCFLGLANILACAHFAVTFLLESGSTPRRGGDQCRRFLLLPFGRDGVSGKEEGIPKAASESGLRLVLDRPDSVLQGPEISPACVSRTGRATPRTSATSLWMKAC